MKFEKSEMSNKIACEEAKNSLHIFRISTCKNRGMLKVLQKDGTKFVQKDSGLSNNHFVRKCI